ncbi:unnamed protein product [Ectocarpus sp. 4 AP-2014]
MMKGTLWKSTSNFVGSMEKRFCVLVGTLVLDFESEDDFSSGVPPKAEGEVIGVSAWKGKSLQRGAYPEGFVYVTRLGHTNYCAVQSKRHHDEWMLWMRTALDMALGTDGVGPAPAAGGVAISREALHRGMLEPPRPAESEVCMKSGVAFGMTQSRHYCSSCGRVFVLEHCNQRVPLPHHGFEQAVRVCDDCLEAQQHLTHLRYICCTLDAHLHDQRRANRGLRASVVRRLGRQPEGGGSQAPGTLSSSLQVGLDLLEQGELSEEEFSGLVKAEEGFQKDEAYNRVHAGCLAASARLGDSTLAVVGLLHRGAAAAPWREFRAVVLHLRMLAEKDLDSIDFFWPQVLHAFYLLVPTTTAEGVFKAELLEDFILTMALRSTHLALKLVWWLKGYVEDLAGESAATPGKGATGKQAHLIRLAVEVEDIVLARADEANSSISSTRNYRWRSCGGGGGGGSGCSTDEKESGWGDGGGTAATTAVAGVSLAGSAGAGGASAVTRGEGGPEATTVEETAVTQPDFGHKQQPARPLDPVGKTSNGATPAIVGAPGIEKKGMMPVEPAIDRATSSPLVEPAARTTVAGGEEASCYGDGGSVDGDHSDGRSSRAGEAGGDTRAASPPFERRLLTTLVRPTGAQSSLVGDELLLLRALRAAAAEQLGLDYVAKTRYTSWVESGSGGEEEEEEEEMERGESEARYFEDQLTFVQSLVDIAERLRFVEPVTARGEHLKRELRQLQKHGDNDYGGNAAAEVVDGSLREADGRAQAEVGCSSTSGGSGQGEGSACVSGDSSGRRDGEVHGPATEVERGGDAAGSGGPAADAASQQRKPSGASKKGEGTAVAVVDEKRMDNLGCRGIDRDRCGAGVGVVGAAGGGGGGGRGPRGFLPVCRATEPICPIVSIPPEEGHVFKTKQRAPTLITCEIIVPQQARRRWRRRQDDGVGGFEEEGTGGPESAHPLPPLSPTALPATAARRASNASGTGAATAGDDGNGNGGGGGVTLGIGAGGALSSHRALHGSGGSSAGGGGGGGNAGVFGGVAVAREEGGVTRSQSSLLQLAVSGPGRAGGSMAPGGDGNAASPLRLQRREISRGSEREEVEEMIESQIEGQGSLGRSIDNKDADGGGSHRSGSGSFGGGTGSGGLVPPTPPRAGAGYPWSTPQPQAPRLLQRTHSDPPLPRTGYGGGGGGGGGSGAAAAAERCDSPVRLLSLGVKAKSVPSRAGRGPHGDTGSGEDGDASLGDSAVYPEVLSAVGLEPASWDGGARPATAPAVSAGFVAPDREAFASVATPPKAGWRDGSGSDSVTGKGTLSPPSLKNKSASGSKLSLMERQDLVLPEPVREKGRTGEEQASDVADFMLRSHGGHELLRHSPLGKKASVIGDEGKRSARGWGEAEGGSSVGDAAIVAAADGNGDEGASSSTRPTGDAGGGGGGGGDEEGTPLGGGGGGGGAVERDPKHADIEREVREQQGGGVRTDGSGGVESGGGLQRKESMAVSQARELLLQGLISSEELEAVVQKDQAFTEVVEQHAFLDVQFCVGQAFGESWAGKRARIQAASALGSEAGWDLVSIIVKSNDDMRQEVCALQLIGLCQRIFAEAGLDLFLQPYVIVSTGSSSGLVQCLTDAMSIDALKKNAGFVTLRDHFERTYGEPASSRFLEAQRNFVNSLAAYSLASYVLQIKDRHNGNILLDTEGRLIHIDFGFILGMAPGGNFALENCPFKLPTEYVDVMGGLESQAFMDFVVAFTCGFLTLQAHGGRLVKLLGMMTQKSPFPCFQGKDPPESIVAKLSERLMPHLDKSETVAFCLELIRESYNNYGQRQFDYYQWLTNGIVA